MPRFSFEEAQFGLEGELDELDLDAGESEQPAAAKPCGCRQYVGSPAELSNEFEGVQFDDEAEFEGYEHEESSDVEFSDSDLEGEVRRPPSRRRSVSRRPPSRPARHGAPPRRPGVRPSRRPARPGRPRVRPRRPRPSRPVGFAYPSPLSSRPPVAEPDGPPWTSDAEPVEPASEFVRWVQSSLNQLMGLQLPMDGVAGPATRSAIRDFQRRQGLPVDGIVGPDTRQALQRARAGRNGGSNGGDDAAGADGDDLSGPEASSTEESSSEEEEGLFDTVRDVLAGTRIIDLTAQADKSKRKGRREPKSVYALVLHQMACCFARKDPLKNYLRTNSHFVILSDGRILQLHPISELLWASHGFNKGSVAVEFAGNFPSTRGKWWKGETYGRNQVTPAQIEAGRYLVRHLIRTMGLTHVLAHRQSSATRENDPGPDIWYHVGQWAIENHNLKDGGAGFKVGGGNSIPDVWRTWGRTKPQPELAEELDPESPEHDRWLQQALNRTLGLRLRPNAAGGPAVRSALRSFQRRHGLPVDGELTEEVEALLVEAGAPPHRHPASHWRIAPPNASRRAPMRHRYSSEESLEYGPDLGEFRIEPFTALDIYEAADVNNAVDLDLDGDHEVLGEVCRGFEIDTADYIKWVQRSLNRIVGSGLTVDGQDTKQYRDAVKEFQQAFGFKADGKVDRKEQDKLILVNEKHADYVEWAQRALNMAGAGLVPDGKIGSSSSNTKKAIRAYQDKNKPALCVDGFLGAKTELLLKDEGVGPPPGDIAPKPKALPKTPPPTWIITDAQARNIRSHYGQEILDWARIPPAGTEAKEFDPPASLKGDYKTIFAWKSRDPQKTCLSSPRQTLQFLVALRDDKAYWDARTGGKRIASEMGRANAARANLDYREYIIGRRMCPMNARNRLRANDKDVLYQMFIGAFQLLPAFGVPNALPQHTEAFAQLIAELIARSKRQERER